MCSHSVRTLRPGLTRVEVVVSIVVVFMLAAVGVPAMQGPFEAARLNSCKNNMRMVSLATFSFANEYSYYPGYMNLMTTDSGRAYRDPATNEVTPVNWIIELLPRLDRKQQYDAMRRDLDAPNATGRFDPKIFVEMFVCPSLDEKQKSGPRLSYVANTGMPDLPAAILQASGNSGGGSTGGTGSSGGIPRDWPANGMFFDNYSEHPLVKANGYPSLMVTMRPSMIEDPQNMTIMFSENLDAKNYLFTPEKAVENPWYAAEAQVGCVWKPGLIDGSTMPPTMTPPNSTLAINVRGGWGNFRDWKYARPSSNHTGGVNIAFAAMNIDFLRDDISYFVFAKLMTSNDAQIKEPGTHRLADLLLREYPLTESNLRPR